MFSTALGRENLVRAGRLRVLGDCYVAGGPPALLSVAFRSASRLRSRMLFLGARAAGSHCVECMALRLKIIF